MNSDIESLFDALRNRLGASPHLANFNILSVARASVRLATQRVPAAQIELGESRIGGIPDLPPSLEWPRWIPRAPTYDRYGRDWNPSGPAALGFIAQIDLSSIPNVDGVLPTNGWLYFFYDRYCEPWGFDPADRGCCRAVYAECDRSSLTRTQPPSDADPEHMAEPCLVEAWAELTLPDDLPGIEYGTAAYEAYRELCDELAKPGGFTQHRLLGHPQLVQNPMELECQLASNGVYCGGVEGCQSHEAKRLQAGTADWQLLLQIDTDEDGPGWMWGDCGRIYFWIKKQDLAVRRFADVWLIFQCC